MAPRPEEGDVYLIDRRDGKPPHYWIVTCMPNALDMFVVVSFTDARNYPINRDVWEAGSTVVHGLTLTKDSVLQLRFSAVRDAEWLSEWNASYVGRAHLEVLERVRCNFTWFIDQLPPIVRQFTEHDFPSGWQGLC